MLPDFDKNAVFIWACYGIGAIGLSLTILIVTLRAKASQAKMQRAEARLRGDDAA